MPTQASGEAPSAALCTLGTHTSEAAGAGAGAGAGKRKNNCDTQHDTER